MLLIDHKTQNASPVRNVVGCINEAHRAMKTLARGLRPGESVQLLQQDGDTVRVLATERR